MLLVQNPWIIFSGSYVTYAKINSHKNLIDLAAMLEAKTGLKVTGPVSWLGTAKNCNGCHICYCQIEINKLVRQ